MGTARKATAASMNADQILDSALQMAQEQNNWYDLSLLDLANRCDLPVNDIRSFYPDTNAIANAWFSKALDQMLALDVDSTRDFPVKTRLEYIIWRWFEALAPYHQVTAQMLKSKLHPPHIHHWVPMVFDLSRLVQLWRESAGLRSGGRRRQIEETVLTTIFLVTLKHWCRDQSTEQSKAHAKLLDMLEKSDRQAQFWFSDKTESG